MKIIILCQPVGVNRFNMYNNDWGKLIWLKMTAISNKHTPDFNKQHLSNKIKDYWDITSLRNRKKYIKLAITL